MTTKAVYAMLENEVIAYAEGANFPHAVQEIVRELNAGGFVNVDWIRPSEIMLESDGQKFTLAAVLPHCGYGVRLD